MNNPPAKQSRIFRMWLLLQNMDAT